MCRKKFIDGKLIDDGVAQMRCMYLFIQVIGMMTIEMIGSLYCPLSPRDPQLRLHELVQQTQSHLVLSHFLTKTKFNENITSLDIDSVLTTNDLKSDVDIDRLSSVLDTPNSIAYIIFTSGSTGTPKAVSSNEHQ